METDEIKDLIKYGAESFFHLIEFNSSIDGVEFAKLISSNYVISQKVEAIVNVFINSPEVLITRSHNGVFVSTIGLDTCRKCFKKTVWVFSSGNNTCYHCGANRQIN